MDIVGVISNHKVGQQWSENTGLPFHYRSGGADARAGNEAHLLELIKAEDIELVILARYMQILSPKLATRWPDALSIFTIASCPVSKARCS